MRHRCKAPHLSRPADQRKAMLRSLVTKLFLHDQITTTLERAKAVRPLAESLITTAKQGNVHAIRQAARWVYLEYTGEQYEVASSVAGKPAKLVDETVLRRLFRTIAPKFAERKGGYLRIIPAPPRRGDAAPMAVIQLVDA